MLDDGSTQGKENHGCHWNNDWVRNGDTCRILHAEDTSLEVEDLALAGAAHNREPVRDKELAGAVGNNFHQDRDGAVHTVKDGQDYGRDYGQDCGHTCRDLVGPWDDLGEKGRRSYTEIPYVCRIQLQRYMESCVHEKASEGVQQDGGQNYGRLEGAFLARDLPCCTGLGESLCAASHEGCSSHKLGYAEVVQRRAAM